jgi:hypothetical protein
MRLLQKGYAQREYGIIDDQCSKSQYEEFKDSKESLKRKLDLAWKAKNIECSSFNKTIATCEKGHVCQLTVVWDKQTDLIQNLSFSTGSIEKIGLKNECLLKSCRQRFVAD